MSDVSCTDGNFVMRLLSMGLKLPEYVSLYDSRGSQQYGKNLNDMSSTRGLEMEQQRQRT